MSASVRAAVAAVAMSCSQAWAVATNYTGLWVAPAESGWGLNLIQQGDLMFGTLFVYGADNQPRWYSASSISCDDGPRQCNGALYESSGSPYSAPFDASTASRRQVGSLSIAFAGKGAGATLDYTVDGMRVTKSIVPLAWRMSDVAYGYGGVQYKAGHGTSDAGYAGSMTVTLNGNAMRIDSSLQNTGTCSHTGTAAPWNMALHFIGTYNCTGGVTGSSDFFIEPTPSGFTTTRGFIGDTTLAMARFGADNWFGNGWQNDLYIARGESGWGLNLLAQGDTMFGTLFVYDANRRPKWYSASSLTFQAMTGTEERGRYTGPLFESTGPWLGMASFDAGAVTRRQAGTMSVELLGPDTARVTYTIDGVTVKKDLNPFAFRLERLTGNYFARAVATSTNATTAVIGTAVIDEDTFSMTIPALTGQCTLRGPSGHHQYGRRSVLSGLYTCDLTGSGSFSLSEVELTREGFTGILWLDNTRYHIAAARIGT